MKKQITKKKSAPKGKAKRLEELSDDQVDNKEQNEDEPCSIEVKESSLPQEVNDKGIKVDDQLGSKESDFTKPKTTDDLTQGSKPARRGRKKNEDNENHTDLAEKASEPINNEKKSPQKRVNRKKKELKASTVSADKIVTFHSDNSAEAVLDKKGQSVPSETNSLVEDENITLKTQITETVDENMDSGIKVQRQDIQKKTRPKKTANQDVEKINSKTKTSTKQKANEEKTINEPPPKAEKPPVATKKNRGKKKEVCKEDVPIEGLATEQSTINNLGATSIGESDTVNETLAGPIEENNHKELLNVDNENSQVGNESKTTNRPTRKVSRKASAIKSK